MKKPIFYLIFLGAFSCCEPFDLDFGLDQKPTWCSFETNISVNVADYYSQQPLPGIKIQVFRHYLLSPFLPYSFKEFSSNSAGMATTYFPQDSFVTYHLEILPSADTTHIYPWSLSIKPGCENDYQVLIKPVQDLTLKVKNNGLKALGKTTFCVFNKVNPSPPNSNKGYLFGSFRVDTIPIGFEKQFKFKVLPNQDLIIFYTSGYYTKELEFTSDTALSSELVWSL